MAGIAGIAGVATLGLTAGARAFMRDAPGIPGTGGAPIGATVLGTVGPLMVENTAGRSGSRAGSTGEGTGVKAGFGCITSAAVLTFAPTIRPLGRGVVSAGAGLLIGSGSGAVGTDPYRRRSSSSGSSGPAG